MGELKAGGVLDCGEVVSGDGETLREGERVFLTWDEDAALRLDPNEKEETAHA